MSAKTLIIVIVVLNAVVLIGQLWPEGAPPFARGVNIFTIVADIALLVWMLRGNSRLMAIALLVGCTSWSAASAQSDDIEEARKSILGRWVDVSDTLSQLMFESNGRVHSVYANEALRTDVYKLTPKSCDQSYLAIDEPGVLFLIKMRASGDTACFELLGLSDEFLSLRYSRNGRLALYGRKPIASPENLAIASRQIIGRWINVDDPADELVFNADAMTSVVGGAAGLPRAYELSYSPCDETYTWPYSLPTPMFLVAFSADGSLQCSDVEVSNDEIDLIATSSRTTQRYRRSVKVH